MAEDATWSDSMPGTYDRFLGPMLFAPCADYLARTLASSTPRRVLELAAGTGIARVASENGRLDLKDSTLVQSAPFEPFVNVSWVG